MTVLDSADIKASRVYRLVWRWHFYAGLIVIPFVLLLAITGSLYLFKPQIEAQLYKSLYTVTPNGTALEADALATRITAAYPKTKLLAFAPSLTPDRSASAVIAPVMGPKIRVFIDPYDGRLLGSLQDNKKFMQIVRNLHGKLLSGTTGQIIVETAASWAVILLVTGLYLWWPRGPFSLWGTFLPRLANPGRTLWRDLHSVTAIWFSLGIGFLLITGLPWSIVSGAEIDRIADWLGEGRPEAVTMSFMRMPPAAKSADWLADHAAMHMAGSDNMASSSMVGLNTIIEIATKALPVDTGAYEIKLPGPGFNFYSVVSDADDPASRAFLHLDPEDGHILSDTRWKDFGVVAKAVAVGVAIHEGRYFGWLNQLAGLMICMGLIAIVVTGIIMWWKRRPPGALGAPKISNVKIPVWMFAVMALLASFMPLFALSGIVFLTADRLAEFIKRRQRI